MTRITAFVGLGANLGDARGTLLASLRQLRTLPDTMLIATSSFYRTAPVDAAGPDFVNAVAQIETGLAADALLAELQRIEASHGRERPYRHAPRTLDLDLLLYGDERIARPELIVPHPRMCERAFVLAPLAELAPELVIPGGARVADCLAAVADQPIERLPA
jgi:2-amino-4-hydroxy-6-hydroxymethyldihydropteridine diphosphokinase